MYSAYFGLKEKPFAISPDPRYLFLSDPHREALEHLRQGIALDGCFLLITGDVGTGKTTVCRYLLGERDDCLLIPNPRLTPAELLSTICDGLHSVCAGSFDCQNSREQIQAHLVASSKENKNVVLLIDEAQNASGDVLEELCLLADLEYEGKKLLKIVLLGQPELRRILEQVEVGAGPLSERVSSRYHLLPLDKKNTALYVRHRLVVAGESSRIFSHSAVAKVYTLSGGVPRLINDLCDRALQTTYLKREYLVTPAVVEVASSEDFGELAEAGASISRPQLWFRLVGGVLLFLLVAGSLSWFLSGGEDSGVVLIPVDEQVPQAEVTRIRIIPLETRE
jgi:general secretion pathway protein A